MGAAADPLAFLRGVFAPSSKSTFTSVTSTGVTKVGPKGEWILAVGVEEELLPGRRTGLQVKGADVVSRKHAVEEIVEEGLSEFREIRDTVEGAVEEVRDEADRIAFEAKRKARAEARDANGWRSQCFDI